MALRPLLFTLRALGLGDFLVGVPAYRALRKAFPDHEFRLATTPRVATLIPLVGGIDGVAAANGPDDFALPGKRPDVAVNLHGRGPQSTRALKQLQPRHLIYFRQDAEADVSSRAPVWDDEWPFHERTRWCHLLEASGIAADPADFLLERPDIEPGVPGAVVIHPGAAFGARRWPPERFAAVARALADDGHDVVVTGSSAERPLAEWIATAAQLPKRAVLAGTLGLLELAALIAHSRLLVCGDTGPAHLATAYATPSVVLFGPTPPHRWGPPASPRHVALWRDVACDHPGDPWGTKVDPRLASITAGEVIAACHNMLASATVNSSV